MNLSCQNRILHQDAGAALDRFFQFGYGLPRPNDPETLGSGRSFDSVPGRHSLLAGRQWGTRTFRIQQGELLAASLVWPFIDQVEMASLSRLRAQPKMPAAFEGVGE